MKESISILLGAGFSAPIGYPIGNVLNETLLKCMGEEFAFHTSGQLVTDNGKKPNFGYQTNLDISFEFCITLIHLFNKRNNYFDYEEFYDFILGESIYEDVEVNEAAKLFLGRYSDVKQLIYSLKNVYNQVVAFYIKDRNGKVWYDDEPYVAGTIFPGYSGFLNSIKSLSSKKDFVNIHTLNHDMFFERLGNTEWFGGELCDGFEELSSPYFGQLNIKGRNYTCRLPRYTGVYDKKYRLYKLHGSFDYSVYYSFNNSIATPEVYIKSRYGIGFDELFKEALDQNGNRYYESCWVNYHADFLTGTTSKIQRYSEPLLYKELFKAFIKNLSESDSLIIIGYGCKDLEVNKMIVDNFDYKNKPLFVVDPYPGKKVKELCDLTGARLIEKQLESISIEDLHLK